MKDKREAFEHGVFLACMLFDEGDRMREAIKTRDEHAKRKAISNMQKHKEQLKKYRRELGGSDVALNIKPWWD